jgi:hypothetical protein
MSEEIKEIIRKVTLDIMKDFDSRINVLVNHMSESDANYVALVTLLSEKRVITTDEFDKKQAEIMENIKSGLDEMRKYKVKDGLQ